jgi:hypothetical protein
MCRGVFIEGFIEAFIILAIATFSLFWRLASFHRAGYAVGHQMLLPIPEIQEVKFGCRISNTHSNMVKFFKASAGILPTG